MMQKLKSIFVTLGALSVAFLPTLALVPASVSAATTTPDIYNNLCSGTNLDLTQSNTDCSSGASNSNLQSLLTKIINIFSVVVGIIAVIMIIVGGLRYITSGGDTGRVGAAKTTIIYALVGLVVVALAQLIVRFVLNQSQSIAG
jgi:hypothetical protein